MDTFRSGFDGGTEETLNTGSAVPISVIIPVYNVEKYLEQCLNSVINQTYSNMEIICVDDGSTDKSGEILDTYAKLDSRIVVIHKGHGGPSSARNAAFPYVKGTYIYFLDSDDWIECNTLEECVSHMTGNIDIVISGIQVEDRGARDPGRPDKLQELKRLCSIQQDGRYRLDDSNYINNRIRITPMAAGKLFKTEIIKRTGLTFLEGRRFEDNHFTMEYIVHSKNGYFIHSNLYHYVQRPGSLTYSPREKDYEDILYVFDHFYKRLEKAGLLKNNRNLITRHYASILCQAYRMDVSQRHGKVKELATRLAGNYDPDSFGDSLVEHVRNREYGKVPAFDNAVIIILKATNADKAGAFKTIKSLLAQSYKLPKIVLHIHAGSTVAENVLSEELAEYGLSGYRNRNLFIVSGSSFSLADRIKDFPGHVALTAESGAEYPANWLRCVMAAFSDYKDAYTEYMFDSVDEIGSTLLFHGFAVVDVGPSGKAVVLKPKRIIVSLTSYPARINSAVLALKTIYRQTKKPDEVVLWLAEADFPNKLNELPEELLKLVSENGLSIRWCEKDLKSHNKYFRAFKEYPDALVITVDDDILYHEKLVENLFLSYLLHPHAVSAAVSYLIPVKNSGEILPYKLWPKDVDAYIGKPSMQLMALGVGGVLYPVRLFLQVRELLDEEAIQRCCLSNDDLWLKAMELVADIPVVTAEAFQGLYYTPNSQGIGLLHENVDGGRTDRELLQIQKEIDRRYGKNSFCRMLMKPAADTDLTGEEALCGLIEHYRKKTTRIKVQYAKYDTLRVDIKNQGNPGCNVEILAAGPGPLYMESPTWLPGGVRIESAVKQMMIALRCRGDGELIVWLRGRDVRNAKGERYPVWIDCNRFTVNGRIVFNEVQTVCHDKFYRYSMPVSNGETVELEFTWSECRSSAVLGEIRRLQNDLKKSESRIKAAESSLKNADGKIKQLETEKDRLAEKLEKRRALEAKTKRELERVKAGWSFKAGRVITWLPRKIRQIFKN